MHQLLEAFFSLFGKRTIGQVFGATAIGAILVGLHFLRSGERPAAGEFSSWLIAGVAGGFTAGLILVSPRVFFGALFGLLGVAIAIVPISHADGTPVPLSAYVVKVGVGAGFMFLSILLMVSRLGRMQQGMNGEQGSAAEESRRVCSETN